MQSDGNSLCGDVVLDSFNMVYRDEDSIYDQNKNEIDFLHLGSPRITWFSLTQGLG